MNQRVIDRRSVSRGRAKLAALAGAASVTIAGGPAFAQSVADGPEPGPASTPSQVDEVVVTAQRRSESLLKVPLAVSALSGEVLRDRGIAQPTALASIIPNLQVNDSTGGAEPNFTLRGVGLGNDFSSNQASPVGVYVDDSYMAFRATYGAQMFDLDRVEVLRGPQGTLFGRNTTGGAINFITRKPALNGANGSLDLGYGNFNQVRVGAAAEATIIEGTLGVRGAISYDRHDGYIDNVFPGGKDLATADNLRGRLSLRFQPTDQLDVDLRLFGNRSRQIQPGVIQIGLAPGGVNPFTGYTRGNLDFFEVSSDDPRRNTSRSEGGALTVQWRLDDAFTLQSLSSYDTAQSLFGQDVDGSPVRLLETRFDSDYSEFNQELRLVYDRGPLKAQGGVFYGRDRIEVSNLYNLFPFLEQYGIPADPTLTAGGATISQAYTQIRTSKAVFGQADVEVLPRLTLTVGLRYTEDTARYQNGTSFIGDYDFNPLVQVIGAPGAPLERNGKNDAVTGRVALSYTFEAGPIIYASYNRGYRAGTFNGSGYIDASQVTFVEPESVDAYEVGAKGRFFDGKLRLAAAAFQYEYSNQQIQDVIGVATFLRNAGASKLAGVEVEASLRFTPTAIFSGSVGYTDSQYDELTLQGLDLEGNELPFTPKVTASGRFDVEVGAFAGGNVTFSPSVTYTSSQWFTPYNDKLGYGIVRQGAYAIFDAELSWKNGPLSVQLWGKNLGDKGYYTYGNYFAAVGFAYFNTSAPRTFGLSVHREF